MGKLGSHQNKNEFETIPHHTLEKIQNELNIEMSNFNNDMRCSWEMNDLNFLLQNQNDLLITESNFPILDPLDISEHFAAVHFDLKCSSLWLQ